MEETNGPCTTHTHNNVNDIKYVMILGIYFHSPHLGLWFHNLSDV